MMKNKNWISIEEDIPKRGFEVLLYNKNWIDEDFNPQGIRIGFLDDLNGWTSAYWCNYHDEYHTRTSDEDNNQFKDFKAENQIPTHWMKINAKCECIIAVISLNAEDFQNWKENNILNNDVCESEHLKRFDYGNTRYYCITKVIDLHSLSINEIIETENAKENNEYNQIIKQARLCLYPM